MRNIANLRLIGEIDEIIANAKFGIATDQRPDSSVRIEHLASIIANLRNILDELRRDALNRSYDNLEKDIAAIRSYVTSLRIFRVPDHGPVPRYAEDAIGVLTGLFLPNFKERRHQF